MREERLAILTMVSEGKITADEGAKLLEVMSQEQTHDSDSGNVQAEKSAKFAEPNDNLSEEIRNRLNGIYKDVEPKLKKAVLAALESASESATLISRIVHESINESIREETSKL